MAQGSDICTTSAFLEMGYKFDAFVPFKGMESKWPTDSRRKWRSLLDNAKTVRYICQDGYAAWKFLKRDEVVVDSSDLMFFLLDDKPEKSGTRHTYNYAVKQGKQLINLWNLWEDYNGSRI
jgi:uncharacterized phage-like protein YoqJ